MTHALSLEHEPELGESQTVFLADYEVEHTIEKFQRIKLAIDKRVLLSEFDLTLRPFRLTRTHETVQAQDPRRLLAEARLVVRAKNKDEKELLTEAEVLTSLKKRKLRPATENEGLSLYARSPHLFTGRVCCLGSYFTDRNGRGFHAVIDATGDEPIFTTLPREFLEPRFPLDVRYLGVRAV